MCAKDVNDLNKDRKLVQTVETDGPVYIDIIKVMYRESVIYIEILESLEML